MPLSPVERNSNRRPPENPENERESEAPSKGKKKTPSIDDGLYRGLSRLRDGFCRPRNPAKFFANPLKKIERV